MATNGDRTALERLFLLVEDGCRGKALTLLANREKTHFSEPMSGPAFHLVVSGRWSFGVVRQFPVCP